jgi:hypothetical protein
MSPIKNRSGHFRAANLRPEVQLSPPREELVRKKRTTLCVLPERTLHGGFQAVLLSRSVPDCIFREERLSCLQAPGGGRGIRKLILQLVEFSYLSYRLNEHKTPKHGWMRGLSILHLAESLPVTVQHWPGCKQKCYMAQRSFPLPQKL